MSLIAKLIGLILLISVVSATQYIPELTQSNYGVNQPDNWYVFQLGDGDEEEVEPGIGYEDWYFQPRGYQFEFQINQFKNDYVLALTYQCAVYIAPQLPAGVYEMSAYGIFGSIWSYGDYYSGIGFRVQNQDLEVLQEYNFNWNRGAFKFNSFSYIFNNTETIENARFVFCANNPGQDYGFSLLSRLSVREADTLRYCKTRTLIEGKQFCVVCQLGYVLDSANMCTPKVDYCSVYKNRLCDVCITGFFLKDNTCVRQSPECQQTDSRGLCTQCQSGFSVKQGACAKDPVVVNCAASEYKNTDGVCVEGDILNCVKYVSPSGQCETCISGYIVNSQGQCVFTCPPQTETKKFVLVNGKCVGTDINCDVFNADGSCSVCQDSFYMTQGICKKFSLDNLLPIKVDNVIDFVKQEDERIKKDDSGSSYIARSDGSRLYLTGPFKNLQVWTDESNNLYVKVANGGRQYLTGPYERLYAYEDAQGKWFVIDFNGQRVYIENQSNLRK